MARPNGSMIVGSAAGGSDLRNGARLHHNGLVYVRVTFDQDVTGFTAADIDTTRCTVYNFSAASPRIYNFEVGDTGANVHQITSTFRVNYTGADNSLAEVGQGPGGVDFEEFTFHNDRDTQAIAINYANGLHQDVVRMPVETPNIAYSATQQRVAFANYATLPSGWTPWTHQNSYSIQSIAGSDDVVWLVTASGSGFRGKWVTDEALRRLAQTDYMALSDYTMPAGFSAYRAALQAITTSFKAATLPTTVSWPEVPNSSGSGTSEYPGDIADFKRTLA